MTPGQRTIVKRLALTAAAGSVSVVLFIVAADQYVESSARPYLRSVEDDVRATVALVPGAGVHNGIPSDAFADRLLTAADLYQEGSVEKILVSGDHGSVGYDEVNVARTFLLEQGIAPEDLFLDHGGFDTYDTMWRAKNVFEVTDAIIVTQAFHLPRSVYLARSFDIEAVGIPADRQHYIDAIRMRLREALARVKAVLDVTINSAPQVGGEPIPITGDGQATWDEGI